MKYLENYIACGFPCFLDNRQLEKNLLICGGQGLCEANNTMHKLQQISTSECAHCAKNFIAKSYVDPGIIKCVEEKNKEVDISIMSVEVNLDCYKCEYYNPIEGTFKILYFIPII